MRVLLLKLNRHGEHHEKRCHRQAAYGLRVNRQYSSRNRGGWFARDLQPNLGYAKWENFAKVIEKAKTACMTSGHAVEDHFLDVRKMVLLGSGAERDIAGNRLPNHLDP
ncbi:MAG: hypothetical protein Q8N48_15315 [Thiobacillus sp.]|nr:hypothetical protein [Thiobacillus sp.]MDP2980185.1 hypothetical protein [Thiobacillus sp.]